MLAAPALATEPLEPGDELKVRIPPSRQWKSITVDRNGEIDLGSYGRFKVGGKAEKKAERELRAHLAKYIRNATAVRLKLSKAGRLVLITGQVLKPGVVKIGKKDDAWQAISAAGGAATGADLTRVILVRQRRETIVNVAAYLSGDRSRKLPIILAGDTLFVPSGAGLSAGSPGAAFLSDAAVANKVFVLGAVSRPGMYARPRALTAIAALALAGGPTAKADLSTLRVVTKTKVTRVDVMAWLQGEAVKAPLIPADGGTIVYVPAASGATETGLSFHVNVVGAVTRPGRLKIRGATSLVDVIGLAGGPVNNGDLSDVTVVRSGAGYTLATAYDVEEYLQTGGLVGLVKIHPGDSVYVSRSIASEVWKTIVGVISDLALISAAFTIFLGL